METTKRQYLLVCEEVSESPITRRLFPLWQHAVDEAGGDESGEGGDGERGVGKTFGREEETVAAILKK